MYQSQNITFNYPYPKFSLFLIKNNPNNRSNNPCPMSPNINPNRYGNVIIVNNPGLISLYLGIPYVSIIS